eukprot:364531-Chlamydomonas_euryale.AAC.3
MPQHANGTQMGRPLLICEHLGGKGPAAPSEAPLCSHSWIGLPAPAPPPSPPAHQQSNAHSSAHSEDADRVSHCAERCLLMPSTQTTPLSNLPYSLACPLPERAGTRWLSSCLSRLLQTRRMWRPVPRASVSPTSPPSLKPSQAPRRSSYFFLYTGGLQASHHSYHRLEPQVGTTAFNRCRCSRGGSPMRVWPPPRCGPEGYLAQSPTFSVADANSHSLRWAGSRHAPIGLATIGPAFEPLLNSGRGINSVVQRCNSVCCTPQATRNASHSLSHDALGCVRTHQDSRKRTQDGLGWRRTPP